MSCLRGSNISDKLTAVLLRKSSKQIILFSSDDGFIKKCPSFELKIILSSKLDQRIVFHLQRSKREKFMIVTPYKPKHSYCFMLNSFGTQLSSIFHTWWMSLPHSAQCIDDMATVAAGHLKDIPKINCRERLLHSSSTGALLFH